MDSGELRQAGSKRAGSGFWLALCRMWTDWGSFPELLTSNSVHPLNWFTLYHHRLHTLAFSLVVAALASVLTNQKMENRLARSAQLPYSLI
jgi:hypothetical protein